MEQLRSQRDKTDALLRDLGADDVLIDNVVDRVDDVDVQSVVNKFRIFAEENPAIVLGALSALIAGGAVAAGRAIVKNKKKSSAKRTKRASAAKRTLIEPHPGDKRYVRRDARGRIKESDNVSRSLSADKRRTAKTKARAGQGDRGDR